jgi:glucosamine 6-phosphate synthetase-like amidotransferase/phosphosugar isomerase protein
MDERRSRHPFHMYDAIFAQPEAFVRVPEKNEQAVNDFANGAASCERLFLVGIGTSYHAARVGELLLRDELPEVLRAARTWTFFA